MKFTESISMAFDSVRSNKLRSGLTLLSIAIGIFAIMGAGTVITSLNTTVSSQLESTGQATFQISRMPSIVMGNAWRKYMKRKPITYQQGKELAERLTLAESVGMSIGSEGKKIRATESGISTDPDVRLSGADGNYLENNGLFVEYGRSLTEQDVFLSTPVAIIGNDIVQKIFSHSSPLGQEVSIDGKKYTVIGVLKVRGAVFGRSQDNIAIIPISNYVRYFTDEWNNSVEIFVKAEDLGAIPAVRDQAIGIMRTLRNVQPGDENSFEVNDNDALSGSFASFTAYLGAFGFACGIIALIAAGVGIMNIMLVSVKERTREIGTRKALGATRRSITSQFVIEAITLCQFGGVIGIGLGLIAGLAFSAWAETDIAVPWTWMAGSVLICTILGLIFGSYPAWKAAQLDPIEALRYE